MARKNTRPDHDGTHRKEFERNRKKILETQDVCGICGRPVDKTLRYPHPLSATVDHIVPVSKGGHPSALSNLQLAHWTCNRAKSDSESSGDRPKFAKKVVISNRVLPQSMDWKTYRAR